MILRISGHKFHYEMENLCRVFFPYEKIRTVYDENGEKEEKTVTTTLSEKVNSVDLTVEVQLGERTKTIVRSVPLHCLELKSECERKMAIALFEAMSELTGYVPEWGILTGVRPSKLMTNLIRLYGEEGAKKYFTNRLLVSAEKTKLAAEVVKNEKYIICAAPADSCSLYVSIPFCPSRCSYCSFVSHSITGQNARKLLPEYVDNLCRELEITGKISLDLGINLQTIYFGGGTPTILDEKDLARVCEAVKANFNLLGIEEYTVEAGRPDTVTADKLSILRKNNVSRICINPQSLNNSVLEAIGRNHTARCVYDAYDIARLAGFERINMDLIAGLPDDTLESFDNSLDSVLSLKPENITVHTLALKRSSTLVLQGNDFFFGDIVTSMLSSAQKRLTESGYIPYYMYRQSRSPGNLENIGWCKPGFEGLYNIFMMEECHTVLAVGAGAVTKLKQPGGSCIERIYNFKYPYEYNGRFTEIEARKSGITAFFQKNNNS